MVVKYRRKIIFNKNLQKIKMLCWGGFFMYVTIDSNNVVDKRDIVGIFDIDKLTVFKNNRSYLSKLEKRGKIVSSEEKLPKSFVLCENNGEEEVLISPFMPITIVKRDF